MRRRRPRARPLHERQPHAHHHDVLTFLDVPGRLDHQLPSEPQTPLGPVHRQQPALDVAVAAVGHLAVGVRLCHLLGHDDRDAVHLGQLAVEQRGLRPQLVQRAELVDGQRLDVRAHVGDVCQLGGAHAVLAQQSPRLVEHIGAGRGGVVVGLPVVVHQRQVQQPVEAQQPVRLAAHGRADGRAVGVDVVLRRPVGVQQHVVDHLHRVPHQRAPHLGGHGDYGVLVQRQRPRHFGHQLVGRQRLPRRGQRRFRGRGVLNARIPRDVAQLQRDLKGVGGHVHPREQRRDVRVHVDVGPQGGGLAGGDQFVAGAGGRAVHGGLQVRLPVGQQAGVAVAGLALLRRQHAAHAGQVQRVHALVLAEWHAGPLAGIAIPRQHRLPFTGALLFGKLAHGAAQAAQLLLQRRNVSIQPLTVEIPRLGHFVFDGFQFPR